MHQHSLVLHQGTNMFVWIIMFSTVFSFSQIDNMLDFSDRVVSTGRNTGPHVNVLLESEGVVILIQLLYF